MILSWMKDIRLADQHMPTIQAACIKSMSSYIDIYSQSLPAFGKTMEAQTPVAFSCLCPQPRSNIRQLR